MSDSLETMKGQIELRTHFEDFKENVLKQFDTLEDKINDVTDREVSTEKFIGGMNYEDFTKQVKGDAEWIHDFRNNWKLLHIILGAFYTIIGITIGSALRNWNWVIKLLGWH